MKNISYTCDRCGETISSPITLRFTNDMGKTEFSCHLCKDCAKYIRSDAFEATQKLIDEGVIE
jgi:hypothetical protein